MTYWYKDLWFYLIYLADAIFSFFVFPVEPNILFYLADSFNIFLVAYSFSKLIQWIRTRKKKTISS